MATFFRVSLPTLIKWAPTIGAAICTFGGACIGIGYAKSELLTKKEAAETYRRADVAELRFQSTTQAIDNVSSDVAEVKQSVKEVSDKQDKQAEVLARMDGNLNAILNTERLTGRVAAIRAGQR